MYSKLLLNKKKIMFILAIGAGALLCSPSVHALPEQAGYITSGVNINSDGETIKAYRKREDLSTDSLTLIPLVLAGWCRYLQGIDDEGNAFDRSPDPLLEELTGLDVQTILKRQDIFAVDLYEDGLADKILGMYEEMQQGPGSVRKVLNKYVDKVLA